MLEQHEKDRAPIRSEREIADLERNLTPIISFRNGRRIPSPGPQVPRPPKRDLKRWFDADDLGDLTALRRCRDQLRTLDVHELAFGDIRIYRLLGLSGTRGSCWTMG